MGTSPTGPAQAAPAAQQPRASSLPPLPSLATGPRPSGLTGGPHPVDSPTLNLLCAHDRTQTPTSATSPTSLQHVPGLARPPR